LAPRLIYVRSPAPGREPRLTELLAGPVREEGGMPCQHFCVAAGLQHLAGNDPAVLLSDGMAFDSAVGGCIAGPVTAICAPCLVQG
jgi:hypothetical protein